MDLREFVRVSLTDIIGGVSDAQMAVTGATIVPLLRTVPTDQKTSGLSKSYVRTIDTENLREAGLIATGGGYADVIEFDIAITVESSEQKTSEESKKGEGGLKIYVVSAGVDIQSKGSESTKSTASHVSRIKFRVPVQFAHG